MEVDVDVPNGPVELHLLVGEARCGLGLDGPPQREAAGGERGHDRQDPDVQDHQGDHQLDQAEAIVRTCPQLHDFLIGIGGSDLKRSRSLCR